jgi:pimeloyl-ACP methyl ester carboxylesterase
VSHWWGRPVAETRGWFELARLFADPVFRSGDALARGDGRHVVLVPGFLAGDQTLGVLATWLQRMGYRAHTCGFVANADCSARALARVARKVEALHERDGRRVAVIGHSRGGHLARAIAAAEPDRVSHAISLGADLQHMLGVSLPTLYAVGAARSTLLLSRRAPSDGCLTETCACEFTRWYKGAFPTDRVRMTSIYSKGDGVVRWERQIVPYADCVEVTGSHIGLIFNRQAYRAIAAALALPELD